MTDRVLQLIHTPRSHFARKVRLLLAALAIDVELVDAVNAAEADPARFGPNPLLKVPTLIDAGQPVFESDHIAMHLVRTRDPADRFDVLTADVDVLNARAVLNGVMALEVELILGARSGLDTAQPRFAKMREAIVRSLIWLESNAAVFERGPSYLGFHLLAMRDHVALYDLVPLDYPRLQAHADTIAALPYAAASKPV
jgi:glutathione S-transferase